MQGAANPTEIPWCFRPTRPPVVILNNRTSQGMSGFLVRCSACVGRQAVDRFGNEKVEVAQVSEGSLRVWGFGFKVSCFVYLRKPLTPLQSPKITLQTPLVTSLRGEGLCALLELDLDFGFCSSRRVG